MGADLTEDMQRSGYPVKVAFENASAITAGVNYHASFQEGDEDNGVSAYTYYYYYQNGRLRNMFDVFVTSQDSATAMAGGEVAEIATAGDPFRLMTVTREDRNVQESQYTSVNRASYVCAVASTAFVDDGYLTSAVCGNADVMAAALRLMSREVEGADITFKAFTVDTIEAETRSATAPAVTVWLLILPTLTTAVVGTVLCVRRKTRR